MLFTLLFWLAVTRLRLRLFLLSLFKKTAFANLQILSFAVQVQTQDKAFNRTIVLEQGKLHLIKGQFSIEDPPQANHIQVIFDNTKDAFKLSNELRKDKHKIFNMIQEQQIKVQGDFTLIQTIFTFKEMLDKP